MKLVWADKSLEFELKGSRFRIGRGPNNDIQIQDPLVSSKHAEIRDGMLVDEGSTNGTFLNSQQVAYNKRIKLKVGDKITFGDTTVEIQAGKPYGGAEATEEEPATGDAEGDSSDGESGSSDEDAPRTEEFTGGHLNTVRTKRFQGIDFKTGDGSDLAWHPMSSPNNKAGTNGTASGSPKDETNTADSTNTTTTTAEAGATDKGNQAAELEKLKQDFYLMQRKLHDAMQREIVLKRQNNAQRVKKDLERKYQAQIMDLKHHLFYGEEQEKKLEDDYKQQLQNALAETENLKKKVAEQTEAITQERSKSHLLEDKLGDLKAALKAVETQRKGHDSQSTDSVLAEMQKLKKGMQLLGMGTFFLASIVLLVLVYLIVAPPTITLS